MAPILERRNNLPNKGNKGSDSSRSHNILFRFEPLIAGDHEVFVAGSFNGFVPDRDKLKNNNGIYELRLNLPEGKYQYKFVVDGIWIREARHGI